MKILIVTSSGGHLFKTFQLKPWWSKYERVWVTKKDEFSESILNGEKIIPGNFPEQRNILNFFKNLFFALKLLRTEKPDLIFSMGAGIAPPFFLVAKLYKIKTVFIETFISISQSTISGKMIYPLADLFLVQNKKLLHVYKKSLYLGPIL
ncbi:MAG: PssD/Cps14F family polysaccharide biosynthesis glycosyltransferase [Patescibacteria group bacterium]